MAYFNNPYNNYPYGNFNQYQNMYQQTQPQQPQLNQFAFVNGVEGAKSYQLQPNQTVMLMDSDSPLCYMKSANNIGQSTLRYFKLIEINENELKSNSSVEPINKNYVLKEDFDALVKRFDEFSNKFNVKEGNKNE